MATIFIFAIGVATAIVIATFVGITVILIGFVTGIGITSVAIIVTIVSAIIATTIANITVTIVIVNNIISHRHRYQQRRRHGQTK